jgi:tRNA (mo5U34)-methyltransferase
MPDGDAPAVAGTAHVQARLDELLWYHTIDVAPGVTTRGWFDLRHALDLIPFPEIAGKRCLDIGTWDGFYAYELERRGAAEVVALDVPDLTRLDYPPTVYADPSFDPSRTTVQPQPRSAGFHLLHDVLSSKVEWRAGNIYDLDPADIGTFDVVVVGSLLVHLRDPIRALDAVRRVTRGAFVSVDYVHPPLCLLSRRRPLYRLVGEGSDFQWWLPNAAGLRHYLEVAAFSVDQVSKPFLLRPGPAQSSPRNRETLKRKLLNRVYTGEASNGHAHVALLAHPLF